MRVKNYIRKYNIHILNFEICKYCPLTFRMSPPDTQTWLRPCFCLF